MSSVDNLNFPLNDVNIKILGPLSYCSETFVKQFNYVLRMQVLPFSDLFVFSLHVMCGVGSAERVWGVCRL